MLAIGYPLDAVWHPVPTFPGGNGALANHEVAGEFSFVLSAKASLQLVDRAFDDAAHRNTSRCSQSEVHTSHAKSEKLLCSM
nr:hypothetical protein [Palleronia rufa]